MEGAPDISSMGSFFKGQGHRGQRSNFCISAVLRPIWMKLGECIQVDPRLRFMGFQLGQMSSRSNLFFSVCSPYFSQVLGSICVSYLSSSPQSSYCYVETGKIY